ncbi:MAG: PEP-CTERM sorting domain-containing protein [Nitrospirae bacterium]|nr:MAG: PEP-CTERM sorting domain-containing protein [Nitrospirota bacterium]
MQWKPLSKMCAAATLFLGLMFFGIAHADPIGPDCDTCQGSIYTLSYSGSPISSSPTEEIFRITLDIDTSGYTGGGTRIDAVAIKVSPSVISSSLFDAPGGVGDWDIVLGGLNAGGCSGNGGGFSCADYVATGLGAAVGGTLSWTFDQTIAIGKLKPNDASIKVRYVKKDEISGSAVKVGDLVSESITLQAATPIPEPSTVFLLGTGLLGIGLARLVKTRRST